MTRDEFITLAIILSMVWGATLGVVGCLFSAKMGIIGGCFGSLYGFCFCLRNGVPK